MNRTLLPFLFSAICLAQNPAELFEKAPPDIDEALRARIAKFYQAHVDGKFRLADELVADDSKDFFFAASKTKFLGFEITKINYSENFSKANATVTVDMHVPIPGFGERPMKIPVPSLWKVVDGQWYWYVDPEAMKITPFGKMEPGSGEATGGPMPPKWKRLDLKNLQAQVRADKGAVTLKADTGSSDQVTISNQMPGSVSLLLYDPKLPGVEIKLDRSELKAGEKATLTFRCQPLKKIPASSIPVRVLVQPINQEISIQLAITGSK